MRRFALATATAVAVIVPTGIATARTPARAQKAVEITMWHGQVDVAAMSLKKLADRFNASHADIHVNVQFGANPDNMLQKLETVVPLGDEPDIAYLYGTDAPTLAQARAIKDIRPDLKAVGSDLSDVYPAALATALAGGKMIGTPAVIGDLAVIWNRALFRKAGLKQPSASWSWNDYRSLAKRLTDARAGVYGTAYPASGSEDTVWRLWPMLWQQSVDVLDAKNEHAAFGGAKATKALGLLQKMAVDDKSMLLDQTPDGAKILGLFTAGKLGMMITGAWNLTDIQKAKIDYGVQVLPGFGGKHDTISGSDLWAVFSKSDERRRAAVTFLDWLLAPEQDIVWDLDTGSLPLRSKTTKQASYTTFLRRYQGLGPFVANLRNARHARPQLTTYPAFSAAVGKQIVRALLGRASAQDAIAAAAKDGDRALAKG